MEVAVALFGVMDKRIAERIRRDLAVARTAGISEAKDDPDRAHRVTSSVFTYIDDPGRFADFHALRKTFMTTQTESDQKATG